MGVIPLHSDIPMPLFVTKHERNVLMALLQLLVDNDLTIEGNEIFLRTLKIKTEGRLQINSKEHVVILSGRDKNEKEDRTNSIFLNPTLDSKGNPIKRWVPFKHLRNRPKPPRPKNYNLNRK